MATTIFGDFEWDDAKAESNVRKHGVTFEEGAEAYMDPLSVDVPDLAHAERTLTVGMSSSGVLVVVTSETDAGRTRIISARKATASERRGYTQGGAP